MWKYPTVPEDDLEANADLLGSFWPRTYGGADTVLDFVRATMLAEKELIHRVNDAYDGLSRLTCPVYTRIRRLPLVLKKSEKSDTVYHAIGDGHVIGAQPGSGTIYQIGDTVGAAASYPAPPGLVGGIVLANALTAPSVMLTSGLGFWVDRAGGRIQFASDPFNDPLLATEPVPNDPTEEQLVLWLYEADIDDDLVNKHLAYQLDLQLPSSVPAKAFANAMLDCVTGGTTLDSLQMCLDRLADAPRAIGGETVAEIYGEPGRKWVFTDKNAYRLGEDASVQVAVDQVLAAGDYLTDAAVLHEIGHGQGPALESLEVPASFLSGVSGPLGFPLAETPLVVSEEAGYTRLDWALEGEAADVAAFFDLLHAKGVAAGATLANHMDTRDDPVGNPDDRFLPDTISPLWFLYENVLRGNALVVTVKPASFGPDALGSSYLWMLRRILPPHTALLPVTT